jgi:predicted metal-dependent hydrolase
VRLDGRPIPYRLSRSPRARSVRLRVCADGLRVSAPPGVGVRRVEEVIRGHAGWVLANLDAVAAAAPPPLAHGDRLPLLDEAVTLAVADGPAARWSFRLAGGLLVVTAARGELVDAVVERWYRAVARPHFRALVDLWAPRLGVAPQGLAVRDQRTRWGSASTRGTLSFSWRLMMAPRRIGEYVAVHELAHLVHPDHSPRFWTLVERHWPDHRADRAWLRAHGERLSRGPRAVITPAG